MPIFAYTTIDDSGRKHRGRREAPNESILESILKKDGQWLAEARLLKARVGPAFAKGGAHRAVPRRLLVEFFLQLGIQLKAGIPISNALDLGARECAHAGFRRVQQDLLEQVEAGEHLSTALARHPRAFPPLVIHLMEAGESSGRLAETCRELHRHYEWLDRLMSDIRQALIYPAFILACTGAFVFLLFTFVVPKFTAIMGELKVPLPALTRWIMGLSDFSLAHWPWLLILPALTIVSLKLSHRHWPAAARVFDKIKLSLPVFGNLNRLICLSRFTHNLAVLYRAGIPLLEVLRLSRNLVGNRLVSGAVAELEAGVSEGRPMHEVMGGNPIFPKLILQMVQVGEKTGNLGEALQNVADYYNEVIPRSIQKMFGLLEPVMTLLLIGLVAVVALSIFLPIANLLNAR